MICVPKYKSTLLHIQPSHLAKPSYCRQLNLKFAGIRGISHLTFPPEFFHFPQPLPKSAKERRSHQAGLLALRLDETEIIKVKRTLKRPR
jgi:hypothetical protein